MGPPSLFAAVLRQVLPSLVGQSPAERLQVQVVGSKSGRLIQVGLGQIRLAQIERAQESELFEQHHLLVGITVRQPTDGLHEGLFGFFKKDLGLIRLLRDEELLADVHGRQALFAVGVPIESEGGRS